MISQIFKKQLNFLPPSSLFLGGEEVKFIKQTSLKRITSIKWQQNWKPKNSALTSPKDFSQVIGQSASHLEDGLPGLGYIITMLSISVH